MSRRGISTADRVKRLLLEADTGRRASGADGLLAEPVIVLRGEHTRGFKLFDQDGARIGSAVAVVVRTSPLQRQTNFQLRDAAGGSVFTLRDGGTSFSRVLKGWNYHVLAPDGSESLAIRRIAHHRDSASIAQGDAQIGMIRPGNPVFLSRAFKHADLEEEWPAFVVETDTGHQVARVRLGRPSWRTSLVHLVVEVDDVASEQLRTAVLAATMKAAFIAAVVEARKARRGSHGVGAGYGVQAAADLAGFDI